MVKYIDPAFILEKKTLESHVHICTRSFNEQGVIGIIPDDSFSRQNIQMCRELAKNELFELSGRSHRARYLQWTALLQYWRTFSM